MKKLKAALLITLVVTLLTFLHSSCSPSRKDCKNTKYYKQGEGLYL